VKSYAAIAAMVFSKAKGAFVLFAILAIGGQIVRTAYSGEPCESDALTCYTPALMRGAALAASACGGIFIALFLIALMHNRAKNEPTRDDE